MRRMVPGDPNTISKDILAENRESLKVLFPEAFTEGGVDFATLRQLLGDVANDSKETYGLNWHGKRRARQLALTPSTGTLRPCREDSVDWDTTQNLVIEGDNLEVLKLLQKSYCRRIKVIYIDPPYNTGTNLIYPNDYIDGIRTYLQVTSQLDGSKKLTTNPKSDGRFHTNWLSMIYPRLKLARTLLAEDGVLVCTIDDNEVCQLGLVLREIFEEGNYDHVCVPVIHNPRGVQGKNFSYVHEYAYFVYPNGTKAISDRAIEEAEISWSQFRNWGTESKRQDAKNCFYAVWVKNDSIVGFGEVCNDEFHPQQTEHKNGVASVYPIDRKGVERKWRYARQSVESISHLLRARKTKDGYQIEIGKNFGLYKTIWHDSRYDANKYGTGVLKDLLPKCPFSFPKSLWAVYDSIHAATGDVADAIILDFFAGSGTTGHAVMQLNRDYARAYRFILVQFPEPVNANREYSSITEITQARLRAAASKIAADDPDYDGDLGYRLFRLDTSNIRAWNPVPEDLVTELWADVDHIVAGRTEDDILYELLLKVGLDLCVPIESKFIADKSVHSIGAGTLMACLDETITRNDAEPLAKAIADWHNALAPAGESTVIFRDSAFVDDVAKTNCAETLKQRGLHTVRSI